MSSLINDLLCFFMKRYTGIFVQSQIIRNMLMPHLHTDPDTVLYSVQYSRRDIYTVGAAKSIVAALFAAILGHLKKTFSTFFFRIIYFKMLMFRLARAEQSQYRRC